jgi:hypothetical protein
MSKIVGMPLQKFLHLRACRTGAAAIARFAGALHWRKPRTACPTE